EEEIGSLDERRRVDRPGVEQPATADRGVIAIAGKLCAVVEEVVHLADVRTAEYGCGVEVAEGHLRPCERAQVGWNRAARRDRADHARLLDRRHRAREREVPIGVDGDVW